MAQNTTLIGYLNPTTSATVGQAASPNASGFFDPSYNPSAINLAWGTNSQMLTFTAAGLGQAQVQATNTQIQVAGFTPNALYVGNTIRFSSVSNAVFVVVAISGNTMTLDRSPGSAGTLLDGYMGGSQTKPERALTGVLAPGGSKIYAKIGTYTLDEKQLASGATSTISLIMMNPPNALIVESFTTTPGDGPVFAGAIFKMATGYVLGTVTQLLGIFGSTGKVSFRGISFDGTNSNFYVNLSEGLSQISFRFCKFLKFHTVNYWFRFAFLYDCALDRTGESTQVNLAPSWQTYLFNCKIINFGVACFDSVLHGCEIVGHSTLIKENQTVSKVINCVVKGGSLFATASWKSAVIYSGVIFHGVNLTNLDPKKCYNCIAYNCTNNPGIPTVSTDPLTNAGTEDFTPANEDTTVANYLFGNGLPYELIAGVFDKPSTITLVPSAPQSSDRTDRGVIE